MSDTPAEHVIRTLAERLAAVERERGIRREESDRLMGEIAALESERDAAVAENARLLARIAAVKAWRQSISGWLDSIPPREILRNLDKALAASPTPTGPEPAKCDCGCGLPRATPEPTEETP